MAQGHIMAHVHQFIDAEVINESWTAIPLFAFYY